MKYLSIIFALFALVFCQGFTCALSEKGDMLATSASLGIIQASSEQHSGGLTGVTFGTVGTKRNSGEVEATRPGFINVGGADGITMSGTIRNNDPIKTVAQAARDIVRIGAAAEVAEQLIKGTVKVAE